MTLGVVAATGSALIKIVFLEYLINKKRSRNIFIVFKIDEMNSGIHEFVGLNLNIYVFQYNMGIVYHFLFPFLRKTPFIQKSLNICSPERGLSGYRIWVYHWKSTSYWCV